MITQHITDSAAALAAIAAPEPKNVWIHGSQTIIYNGADLAPLAPITPVSRRQMLTALHRAGLLAKIKSAVAASGDMELQIAFDESLEFQRDNAFLRVMAQALGKSDADVDAIFALALSL